MTEDVKRPEFSQEEEINSPDIVKLNQELKENSNQLTGKEDLRKTKGSAEVADQVKSKPAKKGSSGPEEKDITD